jgi:hypothetical protein
MNVAGGCPSVDAPAGHRPSLICNLLSIHTLRSDRGSVLLSAVSTGIYLSLGIFITLPGFGANVLRGSFNPEPAATERAGLPLTIPLAVETGPFHTSPTRKRGNTLAPSLARRAGIKFNRGQYGSEPKNVAIAVRRGAHRERRVDWAAKGLSSFRNHHDVESEC